MEVSQWAAFMPDLSVATHAFHPTLDSALATLFELNVVSDRITIKMAGFGYPTRWVVEQSPPPGALLNAGTSITLSVAGSDFLHELPIAMWDRGGEEEVGTTEIVEVLDDPLQKAANWLREGGRLFDVRPNHLEDCAQWISLFGIKPDEWPRESWYALAILLPNVQALAGTDYGLRFGLQWLLDLPLHKIHRTPGFCFLDEDDLSFLGTASSRLGVDVVIGDRADDLAQLTFILGPVSLQCYYEFQQSDRRGLLNRLLSLLMPLHQKYFVRWFVQDPTMPPRLGLERENSRLGINSHLGSSREPSTTEPRTLEVELVQ
jgi:hypothetical protein